MLWHHIHDAANHDYDTHQAAYIAACTAVAATNRDFRKSHATRVSQTL